MSSPAAAARALVEGATVASLATLTDDGAPWASLVIYGTLEDGTPVLCVSTLAEHGRNLRRDPRASLLVAEPGDGDPLDRARVTLAGRAEPLDAPTGRAALPAAEPYGDFGDFTYYALRVERVRWVGGYGRMASVSPADYST